MQASIETYGSQVPLLETDFFETGVRLSTSSSRIGLCLIIKIKRTFMSLIFFILYMLRNFLRFLFFYFIEV